MQLERETTGIGTNHYALLRTLYHGRAFFLSMCCESNHTLFANSTLAAVFWTKYDISRKEEKDNSIFAEGA
jgi:hypothetical protein